MFVLLFILEREKEIPEIRDPIHGFIHLSKDEEKIIDTPEFQRLRRIRQLATTYLVYPAAEHTRFSHSLGVMHIASLIFDKIYEKNKAILRWNEDEKAKYRQMLRLASLLHDIAHAPFSHAAEELFDEEVKDHEGMAGKIITESNITPIINKIGKQHGFDASSIAALITGNAFGKYERLITSIFASELDADKMDYLLRDSLYTGVKYWYYDLDRVLNVMTLCFDEGDWKIAIEDDGIEAIEGLILARYFMFTQVYWHRTRRIYDKILLEFLKEILKEETKAGKFPSDVEEFIQWGDYTIINKAKESQSPWANRLLNRVHMKYVFEHEPEKTPEERQLQREYELIIKEELEERYTPYEVIVDREQKVPIKFELSDDGPPTIIIVNKNDSNKIYPFKDRAPIVAKLEEPIYVFRVYADNDIEEEVTNYIRTRYKVLKSEQKNI